jgi:hypothetical protein
MVDRTEQNTWTKYSLLVLTQIEHNTEAIKEVGVGMHELRGDVAHKLGEIRLQTVRELAELEKRVGEGARTEVAKIREHFDDEIAHVASAFESKLGGIATTFDLRIKELNTTLNGFMKEIVGKIDSLNSAVTTLQVKAGLWATAGSVLGVIGMWLAASLPKLFKP